MAQVKPVLRLPSRRDLSILASTLGPMTLIYLCKNLTYIQLQLTATVLAPLTLAAHQLLYSLWTLTSFVTVRQQLHSIAAEVFLLCRSRITRPAAPAAHMIVLLWTGAAGTSSLDVFAGGSRCGNFRSRALLMLVHALCTPLLGPCRPPLIVMSLRHLM